MTGISDELEVFLEAERDIDVPARSERERLLERLEPLLVVPVALAAASAAPLADSAGGAALSGAVKTKVAIAVASAALLGGAVGGIGHAYLASPPAHPSVAVAAAPRGLAPTRAPEPEPAPAEPAAPPTTALSAAATPSLGAPRPETARPAGSLRAERLLLETASAALMRGDPESAMAALRQHAQRFPKGALAEEREVLLAKTRAASRGGTSP